MIFILNLIRQTTFHGHNSMYVRRPDPFSFREGCGYARLGRPMVECMKCNAWSHLQCVKLTKRTAKSAKFLCHKCKVAAPKHGKASKTRPQLQGKQPYGISTTANSNPTTECAPSVTSCLPAVLPVLGNPTPTMSTVRDNDVSADAVGQHRLMPVTAEPTLCDQSAQTDLSFIPKAEVVAMLRRLESSIRMELNVRLLALEDKVEKLSQSLHHKKIPTRSVNIPRRSSSNIDSNHLRQSTSNSLPYRVVWGTPNRCSSQVILKAISALLPTPDRPSVVVKRSTRRRGPNILWWFTIMAPQEIMQRIEAVWHILEAKTSWSLRSSLSSRISCVGQTTTQFTPSSAPPTTSVPVAATSADIISSSLSLNPKATVFQPARPGNESLDADSMTVSSHASPASGFESTLDPRCSTERAGLVTPCTSEDINVAPFLDQSRGSSSLEAPIQAPIEAVPPGTP